MKFQSLCAVLTSATFPFLATGCKTNSPELPAAQTPVPPAQYGVPGDPNAPVAPGAPGAPVPPGQPAGRFGYTGAAPAPGAPAPGAPAQTPSPGLRDVRDINAGANTTPPPAENKPTPPPAPSAPSSSEMPYANAVPGNPLVVTLPGSHASLGQISVEKYDSAGNPTGEPLKRGTQVQIPDPNNPGKKIYFKVP